MITWLRLSKCFIFDVRTRGAGRWRVSSRRDPGCSRTASVGSTEEKCGANQQDQLHNKECAWCSSLLGCLLRAWGLLWSMLLLSLSVVVPLFFCAVSVDILSDDDCKKVLTDALHMSISTPNKQHHKERIAARAHHQSCQPCSQSVQNQMFILGRKTVAERGTLHHANDVALFAFVLVLNHISFATLAHKSYILPKPTNVVCFNRITQFPRDKLVFVVRTA